MFGQPVTVSTILSASRVVLLIPLWYCLTGTFEHHRWWAAAIIALGVATDFLDGYLARRLHQVSELGKVVDPVADKIAVVGLALMLVWLGEVPLWFLVLIVVRDVLILAGGIYIRKQKSIIVQSSLPGKIAVTSTAAALLLATLGLSELEMIKEVLIWLSVLLLVLSFVLYAQRLMIGRAAAVKGNHGNS
jgi:CDP-diacylglycerol--glycerol-3-phosphate 3-phosphatidyltransferase